MPVQKPFGDALDMLAPGATGAELYRMFEGKAAISTIANWRAGRFAVPQWAIDILRAKIHADNDRRAQLAAQIKTGPGKRAGTMNIKKWNAANPR